MLQLKSGKIISVLVYHRNFSREFSDKPDPYFFNSETDKLENISIVSKGLGSKKDRDDAEKEIAKNLDFYSIHYSKELYETPTESLHNIFNHEDRVLNDHNLACDFIIKQPFEVENKELFIILPLLYLNTIINDAKYCHFYPELKNLVIIKKDLGIFFASGLTVLGSVSTIIFLKIARRR